MVSERKSKALEHLGLMAKDWTPGQKIWEDCKYLERMPRKEAKT